MPREITQGLGVFPVGLVVLLGLQSRRCWRRAVQAVGAGLSHHERRRTDIGNRFLRNRCGRDVFGGVVVVYVVELFRLFWRTLPCAHAQSVGEPRSWPQFMLFTVLLMSG